MIPKFYPFYVDVEFEGLDQDKWTPLDPVKGVTLAYPKPAKDGGADLDVYAFPNTVAGWTNVASWICEFCDGRTAMPVGFDLRNRVWPTVVAHVVRAGAKLPSHLMLVHTKWNNCEMVDIRNLVLQGAFAKAEKLTLESIHDFMRGKQDPTKPKLPNVVMMHNIMRDYMETSL